jgi:hypothetical protein
MKIALCFSGQVRDFKRTQHSLRRHILCPLKEHEVVLFAHYAGESPSLDTGLIFENALYEELEPDYSEFQEEDHDVVARSWHRSSPLVSYLRQLRSISISDSLCRSYERDHGIVFDWVFRLRFDNLYITSLEDLQALPRDSIFIPAHDNWRGFNDRFAFGPSELMEIYANRLDHALIFIREGKPLNPEIFLSYFLDKKSVSVERTKVCHHLLRYSSLWKARFLPEQSDDLSFLPHRPLAALRDTVSSAIGPYRYERLSRIWWQRPFLDWI